MSKKEKRITLISVISVFVIGLVLTLCLTLTKCRSSNYITLFSSTCDLYETNESVNPTKQIEIKGNEVDCYIYPKNKDSSKATKIQNITIGDKETKEYTFLDNHLVIKNIEKKSNVSIYADSVNLKNISFSEEAKNLCEFYKEKDSKLSYDHLTIEEGSNNFYCYIFPKIVNEKDDTKYVHINNVKEGDTILSSSFYSYDKKTYRFEIKNHIIKENISIDLDVYTIQFEMTLDTNNCYLYEKQEDIYPRDSILIDKGFTKKVIYLYPDKKESPKLKNKKVIIEKVFMGNKELIKSRDFFYIEDNYEFRFSSTLYINADINIKCYSTGTYRFYTDVNKGCQMFLKRDDANPTLYFDIEEGQENTICYIFPNSKPDADIYDIQFSEVKMDGQELSPEDYTFIDNCFTLKAKITGDVFISPRASLKKYKFSLDAQNFCKIYTDEESEIPLDEILITAGRPKDIHICYIFPQNKDDSKYVEVSKVMMGNEELREFTDYNYNPDSHIFTLSGSVRVVNNIVVTCESKSIQYSLTLDCEDCNLYNVGSSEPVSVIHVDRGATYVSCYIQPKLDGATKNVIIKYVTLKGEIIDPENYIFDNETNLFELNKSNIFIDGDINIVAETIEKTKYKVEFNGHNYIDSNNQKTYFADDSISFDIEAKNGFTLANNLVVKKDNVIITSGYTYTIDPSNPSKATFTYDKLDGNLKISEEINELNEPLTFKCRSSTGRIGFMYTGVGSEISKYNIQYQKNGGNWTAMSFGTYLEYCTYKAIDIIELDNLVEGDIVKFRGNNPNGFNCGDDYKSTIVLSFNTDVNHSITNSLFDVSGNVMSLINIDNFKNLEMPNDYCFYQLFDNYSPKFCNIVDASKLILPCENLTKNCYSNMFDFSQHFEAEQNFGVLEKAPILPAENLASSCYSGMFNSQGFEVGPDLIAENLQTSCYSTMFLNCVNLKNIPLIKGKKVEEGALYQAFRGCISLTEIPQLDFEKVEINGCMQMFYDCKSLTKVVNLSCPSIVNGAYEEMFYGCTNLNYVKVGFGYPDKTEWPINDKWYQDQHQYHTYVTYGWLNKCAEIGKFFWNGPNTGLSSRGSSTVPSSWTINEE